MAFESSTRAIKESTSDMYIHHPLSSPPAPPWDAENQGASTSKVGTIPENFQQPCKSRRKKENMLRLDAPVNLSLQQQDILDRVLAGDNVFFTGSAGLTGF